MAVINMNPVMPIPKRAMSNSDLLIPAKRRNKTFKLYINLIFYNMLFIMDSSRQAKLPEKVT
jgi:hypothetical protein